VLLRLSALIERIEQRSPATLEALAGGRTSTLNYRRQSLSVVVECDDRAAPCPPRGSPGRTRASRASPRGPAAVARGRMTVMRASRPVRARMRFVRRTGWRQVSRSLVRTRAGARRSPFRSAVRVSVPPRACAALGRVPGDERCTKSVAARHAVENNDYARCSAALRRTCWRSINTSGDARRAALAERGS